MPSAMVIDQLIDNQLPTLSRADRNPPRYGAVRGLSWRLERRCQPQQDRLV